MKYYLLINREKRYPRRFDIFLGCFSSLPNVAEYDHAENEEIIFNEFELSEEEIDQYGYIYLRCIYCNSMGFSDIILRQAYTNLYNAVVERMKSRTLHDVILRLKIDDPLNFIEMAYNIESGILWRPYP